MSLMAEPHADGNREPVAVRVDEAVGAFGDEELPLAGVAVPAAVELSPVSSFGSL